MKTRSDYVDLAISFGQFLIAQIVLYIGSGLLNTMFTGNISLDILDWCFFMRMVWATIAFGLTYSLCKWIKHDW